MFVLKPKDNSNKDKGNFVDNLRQTIGILTQSCRCVPKTAFQRPSSSNRRYNPNPNPNTHPLTLPPVIIPLPQLRPHSPSCITPYTCEFSFPSVTRSPSTIAVLEFDSEIPQDNTEIEAEECVLLDEPVGLEHCPKGQR
jgi:hypothetical protein